MYIKIKELKKTMIGKDRVKKLKTEIKTKQEKTVIYIQTTNKPLQRKIFIQKKEMPKNKMEDEIKNNNSYIHISRS